jgi:hypothetical protein
MVLVKGGDIEPGLQGAPHFNNGIYGDWHGTVVPSGTVKLDFLEPLIKSIDDFL